MAQMDATGSEQRGGVAPPPAPADETQDGAAGAAYSLTTCRKAVPRLSTTRGGAGVAAGATPKKSYRPSGSARPRPAGKKPDSGPR
jgi:hypothetical protein